MKIFSWVHRRFNNRGENVNKNGDVSAEEEQFPSENKLNDNAYERWGGGILAIGTFGYDPLMKDENEDTYNTNDYFSSEEEEDGGDSSELEEKNPLVLETQDLMETEMEGNNWSDEEELQFGYEYMMMKKKERTTLADLFTADGDQKQGKVLKKEVSDYKPKTADFLVKGKPNRKSFANKLEARPIQTLNKLMRRMLKRKIHPDVGPTATSKAAAVNINNNNNNCQATDDSASLLPMIGTKI